MYCRGWSVKPYVDQAILRKCILEYFQCDVLALTETFLRGDKILNVEGYTFYGHNKPTFHKNTTRGSAGVGVLVKK